jgi:diaminohydroxyphosphoribosylaminopyrimidine deaminase/5-amino-6-(5-phosphoribosylamino)uracil reductase
MKYSLDERYMQVALDLARERKGYTHPNPTVGAVIVKDGQIIGKGKHEKAGMPHAEREAIKDALQKGYSLQGATMYITLEPCCHYGKTPPCTNAIIDSGVKRVVVATLDPNPKVAGKGIKILQERGIETEVGVLEEEAKRLNEDFFIFITEKRPFVHLKVAQSIDGKIATATGSSKWITGEEARRLAHRLRNEATAVMVGVGTALKDNPSLTVRYIQTEKQPVRVLLDKQLKTPLNFNIFNKDAETVVFTSDKADKGKIKELESRGNIKVITLPLYQGRFSLEDILSNLYKLDIVHLLVEGGGDTITQFLKQSKFDKLSLFLAPKIIGADGIPSIHNLGIKDINDTLNLQIEEIQKIGRDLLIQLYPYSGKVL